MLRVILHEINCVVFVPSIAVAMINATLTYVCVCQHQGIYASSLTVCNIVCLRGRCPHINYALSQGHQRAVLNISRSALATCNTMGNTMQC